VSVNNASGIGGLPFSDFPKCPDHDEHNWDLAAWHRVSHADAFPIWR
jgi:hypothetical protein